MFSRITLENMAGFSSVPRIVIVDKEVIYRSRIYFTPLLSYNEIDYDGILGIVDAEYKSAGVAKGDLTTGAVIITGETSRKDNAERVLRMLSGYAGEFVVATAGPDLEAMLAAKGAGVHTMSKDMMNSIANLDIGGGTTNIAVFRRGQLIDTTCADIGGRLIRVANGKVTYIAPKIKWLAERKGVRVLEGDAADAAVLRKVADAMADVLLDILRHGRGELTEHMLTVSGLKQDAQAEAVTFSGGVADLVYGSPVNGAGKRVDPIAHGDAGRADPFAYGDIGVILGEAIRESALFKDFSVLTPLETIRATVIGAGIHTMDLSGSTIEYTGDTLPLKNLPIIKLTPDEEKESGGAFHNIAGAMAKKLEWYKEDNGGYQTIAVSMEGVKNPSYKQVQSLCAALCEGFGEYLYSGNPIVVALENDMAKALGQSLRIRLGGGCKVVCIDNVAAENGDYIDVGAPLSYGRVVPVIIKTLALNV